MGEKYWGKGSVSILFLIRAVKISLTDKMMFEQNLKEIRALVNQTTHCKSPKMEMRLILIAEQQ